MNIRILSIALLFCFGAQTGLGFDQKTLDFFKKNKRLPKQSEIGGEGDKIAGNLTYADFTGADFRGLDLTGFDLSNANLTGVDLRDSKNLCKAKITGARMRDVNFSGVDVDGCDFSGVLISQANNLLKKEFYKPISIDRQWLSRKGAKNTGSTKGIR